MNNLKEYNTNSCYSNLKCYGAYGNYRPIIPPTPVTVQPCIFNSFKPHEMPNTDVKCKKDKLNCYPYKNLEETCPNFC